jgi:hypothetical protein
MKHSIILEYDADNPVELCRLEEIATMDLQSEETRTV